MNRTTMIVGGIALALAVVLLITIFKAKPSDPRIEQLEGKIEAYQEQIEQLKQKQSAYDSTLQSLQQSYNQNRKTETIIKHHYDKIPIDVRSLDREQLRREVTNY